MRHSRIDTQALYALLVLALSGLAMVSVGAARTDIRQPVVRAPTPPEFELSVNAAGTELRFQGRVDFGLTAAMRDIMLQHPGIRRMTLDSHGGFIAEARGVVTVLSAHRIATHVEGHCASACALIFVGGIRRSMGSTARVGFHGYSVPMHNSYGMIDPQAEMLRDMAIYRAQAVAEPFIAILSSLPRVPMWYPEPAELRSAGVLTAP